MERNLPRWKRKQAEEKESVYSGKADTRRNKT
jgi:hypothetical protein